MAWINPTLIYNHCHWIANCFSVVSAYYKITKTWKRNYTMFKKKCKHW